MMTGEGETVVGGTVVSDGVVGGIVILHDDGYILEQRYEFVLERLHEMSDEDQEERGSEQKSRPDVESKSSRRSCVGWREPKSGNTPLRPV